MRTDSEISYLIINAAIKVHKKLGPGLLERTYVECLACELDRTDLRFIREKPLPLVYENIKLDCGYRLDLLIENKIVIEVKSVEALNDLHLAQTLTYLRVGKYPLGLLINFNVSVLKSGIRRVVNNYEQFSVK